MVFCCLLKCVRNVDYISRYKTYKTFSFSTQRHVFYTLYIQSFMGFCRLWLMDVHKMKGAQMPSCIATFLHCVRTYTYLYNKLHWTFLGDFSFYPLFSSDFLYTFSNILLLLTLIYQYFSTIFYNLLVNSIEIIFSFSFIHLQYTNTVCIVSYTLSTKYS